MTPPHKRPPAPAAVVAAVAARVGLRLHGDPQLRLPDGRALVLERRAAALCALATFEPGLTRERAAHWLWPDSADPRRNLRQQLLRFRQGMGLALFGEGDVLALAEAVHVESPSPAAPLLGTLSYDDCPEFADWLAAQRSGQQAARLATLHDALERAESAGDLPAALATAEQLRRADPASEAQHRTLIRLHYLNHDAAAARAAFEALQRMLADEFGAAPSAETLALMTLVAEGGRPLAAPRRVWVTALQRPPRLVGRSRELAALHQALAQRQALLLRGEAGMGKSRLLAEALDPAAGHVTVKAQAGDAGVPYATLARLLRRLLERREVQPGHAALARLLPEIGHPAPTATLALPAEGERLLLQAAVEQLLMQAHLSAVAVDDLHFADDASLEMLTALVAADTLSSLAWVFTQRPGEGSAAASALRDVLEEAQRLHVTDVAPLDAAQMVELVRSLNLPELDAEAVGQRLLRHTGGNPLFALETLKQMLLPGANAKALPQPASVGALIDRRLKQLSEAALALARVAAIAGPDFGPALAEDVLGRRAIDLADAWTELELAQVLRERAFAHDLVLDATLRSLPKAITEHLHAAVARHLEAQRGEPARLAAHWLAAGDDRRALPWLVRAADQARDTLRRREEAGFIERAARIAATLAEAVEPSAHALWLRAFDALEVVDGSAAALPALDQALAHAHGERERLAVLTVQFAAQTKLVDLANAITNGREALRLALALGDDPLVVGVMSSLAVALSMDGQNAEAEAVLLAHWPAVERLAEPEPSTFTERGNVLDNLERPHEARRFHRQATALALKRGLHSEFVIASGNLAVSHIDAGELDDAAQVLDEAERMRLSHEGMQAVHGIGWNLRAIVLRDQGCYGQALARFEANLVLVGEQMPLRLPLDRLHRAWLWAWVGQWARAQQDMAQGDDYGVLPSWVQARALQLRARIAVWRAQPEGDALERAHGLLDAGTLRPVRDSIRIDLALAAGRHSAQAAGAAHTELIALGEQARRDGYHAAHWAAEWACTGLALAAGRPEAAREHRSACLRRPAGHTPLDCAAGTWWHGLWRLSQRLGDLDRADAARAEGVAWIHRVLQSELPDEFHTSFRHGVLAHRELLAG